ncbi:MAG TPA: Abi family protein [Rhizomicrobium sp.]|nr:Abi family protein [Rhizomicrobium sp.]
MDDYKSIDQLISLLNERGLQIEAPEAAQHILKTVGHYRLESFYRAFYNQPKQFDHSVPIGIEDVANLYLFDRRLRLLILGPLEKLEVALRALIVKELGDFLVAQSRPQPVFIRLFEEGFYDLSTPANQSKYRASLEACRRSAWASWHRKLPRDDRKLPKSELNKMFEGYRHGLAAWEVLQAASFGPLANIFSILRPEIAVNIARYFGLPRHVLVGIFYALKNLRNSCAHHSPVWNWDARRRSSTFLFPRAYEQAAQITGGDDNRDRLYACCAVIHLLLSPLSQGRSTWYRRLKKLINEFNTIYSGKMGFPAEWQTLPFWCVSDVAQLACHERLRGRLQQ